MATDDQSSRASEVAGSPPAAPSEGALGKPPAPPPSPSPSESKALEDGELAPIANATSGTATPNDTGTPKTGSGGGSGITETAYKIQEQPYNPDASRDTTRQTITLWLIGLLCAIVVLTFVALFASGASVGFTGKEFIEGLKAVLNVLVGPVITLLASAVGFYFGSKQGESGGSPRTQNKPSP